MESGWPGDCSADVEAGGQITYSPNMYQERQIVNSNVYGSTGRQTRLR
jgi:hypothetical protein